MGLSVSDIATTIRTSVGGAAATYFREEGEEYQILVRYQEKDRLSSEDVMAIPIQTPSGLVVPVRSGGTFRERISSSNSATIDPMSRVSERLPETVTILC